MHPSRLPFDGGWARGCRVFSSALEHLFVEEFASRTYVRYDVSYGMVKRAEDLVGAQRPIV